MTIQMAYIKTEGKVFVTIPDIKRIFLTVVSIFLAIKTIILPG